MMTQEQRRRVEQSLASANAFIAKEAPRRADLRPAKTQELLDWYYKHAKNLSNALNTGDMSLLVP